MSIDASLMALILLVLVNISNKLDQIAKNLAQTAPSEKKI